MIVVWYNTWNLISISNEQLGSINPLLRSIMDEQYNYFGAAVFWLYIVAALSFTGIVIFTIINLPPLKHYDHKQHTTDVRIFASLAAISFATLSFNMLNVLIQSFQLWQTPHHRHITTAKSLLTQLWMWSITSTPFRDFGEAIVADQARYVWVEAALSATLAVSLYMGFRGKSCSKIWAASDADCRCLGRQSQIPRLWAFFGLSQILPISFTQNLFYIALLRRPKGNKERTIVPPVQGNLLIAAYFCCLLAAPASSKTSWLMPIILSARALLFVPSLLPLCQALDEQHARATNPLRLIDTACLLIAVYPHFPAFGEHGIQGFATALFSHPAVSSLGCDFAICVVSLALWIWTQGMDVDRPIGPIVSLSAS